jgi:hypothetical protein
MKEGARQSWRDQSVYRLVLTRERGACPDGGARDGAARRRSRIGSRKTLHPSDNRHCASGAKNSDENHVPASQRKAKTKSREQGKSDQLP